jgi:4,5-dihydroxyphthalate decarboxylase
VHWFQGGVNQAGREEQMEVPPNLRLTVVTDRSLSQMLAAGDLDAVISARPPRAAEGPDPVLVPLFEDAAERELDWYRRTGVYPIMHVIALRSAVMEEHPWVPVQLYRAFVAARDSSLARACDQTASRVPIPMLPAHARRMADLFADGLFPYGLEANRRTLETFLQYAHEQGVTARLLQPGELFVPHAESGGRL